MAGEHLGSLDFGAHNPEVNPSVYARIMDPELWGADGERLVTEAEVRMLGEIAINDNIILGTE